MADRARSDVNYEKTLIAVSNVDGETPVSLWADPNTHSLLTSGGGGGSSGTQYTDGSVTVAHPVGTIPVFDNGGTITAVSVANPLPVAATFSGTIGTVAQGNPNTLANGWPVELSDGTNLLGVSAHPVRTDPTGTTTQPISATSLPLPTGASTSANQTNGTQQSKITDGTSTVAVINNGDGDVGRFGLVTTSRGGVFNGTTWDRQYGDATNGTWVNIKSSVSLPVTGTFFQATQPVSGAVTVTGSVTSTPSGTQDENLKQVNGIAVNVGIGTASTGTQRVAVSSDSFPASQVISGTVTANAGTGTFNIQSNASVNLAQVTGTATDVNTGNASAGTQRVVLATNQPSLPVTGTFFQTTQPVSVATIPQATLPSTEVNGQTTGTTAGTAVQLASNTLIIGVIIQALSTNVTSIYVGTASVSSSNGFELQPGQATSVGVANTSAVWIVSTTNGDKCCWIGS